MERSSGMGKCLISTDSGYPQIRRFSFSHKTWARLGAEFLLTAAARVERPSLEARRRQADPPSGRRRPRPGIRVLSAHCRSHPKPPHLHRRARITHPGRPNPAGQLGRQHHAPQQCERTREHLTTPATKPGADRPVRRPQRFEPDGPFGVNPIRRTRRSVVDAQRGCGSVRLGAFPSGSLSGSPAGDRDQSSLPSGYGARRGLSSTLEIVPADIPDPNRIGTLTWRSAIGARATGVKTQGMKMEPASTTPRRSPSG
jgi:hypothetical protein